MLNNYLEKRKERARKHLPALPMELAETEAVLELLEKNNTQNGETLLDLLGNWVEPGVSDSARIKSAWLKQVAQGELSITGFSSKEAVQMLGNMIGGYCVPVLIDLLDRPQCAEAAAQALEKMVRIYDYFDRIHALAQDNKYAKQVIESWARARWFSAGPQLPEKIILTVYKVEGEINTDDLSPGNQSQSRTDIPLHATYFGKTRFPRGYDDILEMRKKRLNIAFAGDVLGTGSSRKSAVNSLGYLIGEDIPFVPNKRRGGIFFASTIAPIFYSSARDAGLLPVECEVSSLNTGDEIVFRPAKWKLTAKDGQNIRLTPPPPTLLEEFKAGGRLNLIIGQQLTKRACKATGIEYPDFFTRVEAPIPEPGQGYTLAQKIVGAACGKKGVLPNENCLVKTSTVGSQDTTGPMTLQEVEELACLKFKTDLFLQTFCHTAAYPRKSDFVRWEQLHRKVSSRGGVVLKPGDGVIHSWLNKTLLPDQVGTAGDSHTRFPLGLSFPAGSGLIAFAAALGFMPLEMPESVLVQFKGKRRPGITVRDMVNAIPYFARKQGLLTLDKVGKKNVFAGRIIEIEGIDDLSVDEAFELADSSAERSGSACTLRLCVETAATQVRENIKVLQMLADEGYPGEPALLKRIAALEKWLEQPHLLTRDEHAQFAAVLEIDLDEIHQPLLACPNDPDDVKPLEQCSGTPVDEVFIGSCMTHLSHLEEACALLEGKGYCRSRMWVAPSTRMIGQQVRQAGGYSILSNAGCRIEIPGCSLCMGNQARVRPEATVFSTSTRNFNNRLGDGAKVYLGSTQLAVLSGLKGRLPTPEAYFEFVAG